MENTHAKLTVVIQTKVQQEASSETQGRIIGSGESQNWKLYNIKQTFVLVNLPVWLSSDLTRL